MLTDTEIRTMRERAATWHLKRKHPRPLRRFQFEGGSLAGVEAWLEASAAKAAYVGWCVVTPTGPAQVLYRPSGVPGRLTFATLDLGRR
ncbi:MAG: hypothetical protein ACRD6I_19865 [Candidatus Acidiferrales bacterium]